LIACRRTASICWRYCLALRRACWQQQQCWQQYRNSTALAAAADAVTSADAAIEGRTPPERSAWISAAAAAGEVLFLELGGLSEVFAAPNQGDLIG
jgi:hypothetical protein